MKMKLKRNALVWRGATVALIGGCVSAMVWATPTCTYPDPLAAECRIYVGQVLVDSVDITCRMLSNTSGTPSSASAECKYNWCDPARPVCSSPNPPWLKLERTKSYHWAEDPADCVHCLILDDVTDANDGCCECIMSSPPSWPS